MRAFVVAALSSLLLGGCSVPPWQRPTERVEPITLTNQKTGATDAYEAVSLTEYDDFYSVVVSASWAGRRGNPHDQVVAWVVMDDLSTLPLSATRSSDPGGLGNGPSQPPETKPADVIATWSQFSEFWFERGAGCGRPSGVVLLSGRHASFWPVRGPR